MRLYYEHHYERGGRVKNLYDPSGKRFLIIKSTQHFLLGEELLAAIQMFMPGIPQVWYLDILR
jgi:sucrose phosphorylase